MKNIYYRGKNKRENQWLYAISLLNFLTVDGKEEWYMPTSFSEISTSSKKDKGGNRDSICSITTELLRIIPETLCRYAERKDSKQNDIFEKDIIKIKKKDGEECTIVLDSITDSYLMSMIDHSIYCEVIGNTIDTEYTEEETKEG